MVTGKGRQAQDYSKVEAWPLFAPLKNELGIKMDVLRDYQQEMLSRLEEAWGDHRSVMVQMPTGTGKTHLMAKSLTPDPSRGGEGSGQTRALIVAHRIELIEQISRTLDAFGIVHGLIVSGKHVDETKSVQVASIQTLARRDLSPGPSPKGRGGGWEPELVIIDEAHHALAKTYRMLWEWWPQARFLGLTATPCRLNGKPFTDLFDTLLQSWSIREFIQKGWLSDLDYVSVRSDSYAVQRIARLDKRGADGDFQTRQMAMVLDVPESIEHLYRSYRQYAEGKKGIVYAIDRSHAQHIAEYYTAHGVRCWVIDAKTPATERRRMIEEYKATTVPPSAPEGATIDPTLNGKTIEAPSGAVGGAFGASAGGSVLINVDIFSEGFDCPEVEFIQLARPTMSLSKYLQQVGRGMRVTKNKREVMILDQVGSYLLFGLPTSDRNWQGLFMGKASGKGVLRVQCRKNGRGEAAEKTLVNEQMFRIRAVVNGTDGQGLEEPPKQSTATGTVSLFRQSDYRESMSQRLLLTKKVALYSMPYDGLTRMCMRSLKPRVHPEDYVTQELFALLTRKETVVHVYNSYKKYASGRRGVVLACGHRQAEMIADYFTRNGVRTRTLFDVNGYEVTDAMQEYRKGDTRVLVAWNHKVALPEVELLLLACPMQLMSDYLDIVHGCMRLSAEYPENDRMADSDNELVVIDNTLMSQTFGSPTERRDWQQQLMFRNELE